MDERGKYIVIEGHDGTGKSSQVELLRRRVGKLGIKSSEIHEPAGVSIADELRTIIKNGALERDETTNLLLFTAARHELWRQKIKPSLEQGTWIFAARSWLSTVAYQGYGEGLDRAEIESLTRKFTAPDYLRPDFACVLDLSDESERVKRIHERGELGQPDTFEARGDDFQAKVKRGYLETAKKHGWPVIDASPPAEAVNQAIWAKMNQKLKLG